MRVVKTATILRRKSLLFASNCTVASVLRRPVQRPRSLRRQTARPQPRPRVLRPRSAICVALSHQTTPILWEDTKSLVSKRRGIQNSLMVTRPSRLPSNSITRMTKTVSKKRNKNLFLYSAKHFQD